MNRNKDRNMSLKVGSITYTAWQVSEIEMFRTKTTENHSKAVYVYIIL